MKYDALPFFAEIVAAHVSTGLPIANIAQSLGYADSSGFIRAFRRWTGSSPASSHRRSRSN
jgi:AraC-like DNA-binding protein